MFKIKHPLGGAFLKGFSYPENHWPSTSPVPVWTNDYAKAASYDEQQAQWAAREVCEHFAANDPITMLLASFLGG